MRALYCLGFYIWLNTRTVIHLGACTARFWVLAMKETEWTALTMAASNCLEVKAVDILNADMIAPNRKNIWTVLGPEFGNVAKKLPLSEHYISWRVQVHLLEHILYSAYRIWGMRHRRPMQACGGNLQSDHRTDLIIIHAFYIIWMIFFVSIIAHVMYWTSWAAMCIQSLVSLVMSTFTQVHSKRECSSMIKSCMVNESL